MSLLFTEGPAAHDILETLLWFIEVFTYCGHDSRPHTFTLGLL